MDLYTAAQRLPAMSMSFELKDCEGRFTAKWALAESNRYMYVSVFPTEDFEVVQSVATGEAITEYSTNIFDYGAHSILVFEKLAKFIELETTRFTDEKNYNTNVRNSLSMHEKGEADGVIRKNIGRGFQYLLTIDAALNLFVRTLLGFFSI